MKNHLKLFVTILLTLSGAISYAQSHNVRGTVCDKDSGEPLAGVSVILKGSSLGTGTDSEGRYTLRNIGRDGMLVFSCIGYKETEIAVDGREIIDIGLEEDRTFLDEVVVIGYGTMDKKELTSAIAHISSKDFLSVSGGDPSMMIQGKVSGVSVVNTGAADPNNSASIQIRGISSRAAGLGPLIVVDGVPGGNLANINTNDIESIDILKDGAASAIYGTRGEQWCRSCHDSKGLERRGNPHIRQWSCGSELYDSRTGNAQRRRVSRKEGRCRQRH